MDGVVTEKSTNVRTPLAPWLVRACFAATGSLSPVLAARAGERLFCMPPRRRPSSAEQAALGKGDAFAIPVGRHRLRAWRFGAGPTVLLVHGWGSRSGHVLPLVAPLVEAGCAVVAFDAPAHGASPGRFASGIVFADAITAVAAHVSARAAVGHSMGAAALGWAMANGLALEAAVMLCPPRTIEPFFRKFCAALGVPPAIEKAIREQVRRRHGITPEEFDLCRRPGAGSTPLLVIHDKDDGEVPWTDGEAVARAWPQACLSSTNGLGHRGILRDSSVGSSIASFVRQHLAPCDCGRNAERPAEGAAPACPQCGLERDLFDPSSR